MNSRLNNVMETKRKIYIFAFTILGLLVGFLMVGVVETIYIRLLLKDFITYGFGLNWEELFNLQYLFSVLILVISGLWGYAAGKYWWRQIYVLKKYGNKKYAGLWRF